MVVDYHRSLRSFLPDKARQGWRSSAVYFLWNLLLIAARVAAVALFASVFPAYVALHFLLLWAALFLWAWRQETAFMDTPAGEWLYRATVGLIWYFSWFNVTDGRTRVRSAIYHVFMVVDGGILLVTWWLCRDPWGTRSYALGLVLAVPLGYTVGLLLKGLYYARFHPQLRSLADQVGEDVTDGQVGFRSFTQEATPSPQRLNKRMAAHAQNFYALEPPRPAGRSAGTNQSSTSGAPSGSHF